MCSCYAYSLSKFVHTNGNGYACGNAKFRLVMLMGSALVAKCIEHSSGYLRIREYFSVFFCHKCEYSVIADAVPSYEEEKNKHPTIESF